MATLRQNAMAIQIKKKGSGVQCTPRIASRHHLREYLQPHAPHTLMPGPSHEVALPLQQESHRPSAPSRSRRHRAMMAGGRNITQTLAHSFAFNFHHQPIFPMLISHYHYDEACTHESYSPSGGIVPLLPHYINSHYLLRSRHSSFDSIPHPTTHDTHRYYLMHDLRLSRITK